MAPSFRHTLVVDKTDWNNYHGTVAHRHVPVCAIVDALVDTTTAQIPPLRRHGEALQDILDYCFRANPVEPLKAVGSTWSLSEIITPNNVIVDPGRMNAIFRVSPAWFDQYPRPGTPTGAVPMICEGGARIHDINQVLGGMGLALQTSGASDGHRIAGCVATGSHGSAIQIGAVHDTVLALLLVVAPNQAILVQPATATPFKDDLAHWFEQQIGIPVRSLKDNDAFHAAQVSLGALGFVHSVIIETVPLYRLEGRMIPRPLGDTAVLEAIRTLNTQPLHADRGERPYHFSVVVNPYATGGTPGLFVGLYWKTGAGGNFTGPSPALSMAPSDTAGVLSSLLPVIDGGLGGAIVGQVISSVLGSQNPAKQFPPLFPGQVFGPTSLPAGVGQSTEIVVPHARALDALQVILRTLDAERLAGRHLLGAMGCRFVPRSQALLGMNISDMNMYMELGSLTSPAIPIIHAACWKALDEARIPYTCHWGQQHQLSAAHVSAYYGERVQRWKNARNALLGSDAAKTVFGSPWLTQVGLTP